MEKPARSKNESGTRGSKTGMRGKMSYGMFSLALLVMTAFVRIPCGFAKASRYIRTDDQLSLSQPLTVRWQYESDQTVNLTPATDGERIYLPLAGGYMVSLRALDGQLYWRT